MPIMYDGQPDSDFSVSWRFKDIFPDLAAFTEFVQEYCTEQFASTTRIYSLLFRRYANASVRYDTIDAFKRQFSFTLDEFGEKFGFDYEMISHAYKLTVDDLILVNEAYSASANAPNQEYSDSLSQMWEYINGQTGNRVTRDKLTALISAIDRATDRRYTLFADEFQKHFVRISAPIGYYYKEIKQ